MNERGFSLIEAMIAMVVLLLAMLAMLSVIPFGFNGAQTNSIQVQAVAVAQQYLEDERNALLSSNPSAMPTATTAPIDWGQKFTGPGAGANAGPFAVAPDGCATVSYMGTYVNVHSCSVVVSWTQAGASRSVTVQSYAAKY